MPVVEHHTRWELYALVYHLSSGDNESNGIGRLLQLAAEPQPIGELTCLS